MTEKAEVLYRKYQNSLHRYTEEPCDDQAEAIPNLKHLLCNELVRIFPDLVEYIEAMQEIAAGLEDRLLLKTYEGAKKKNNRNLVDTINKNPYFGVIYK